jgi:soluble lytic murein transglycosylase-like protein
MAALTPGRRLSAMRAILALATLIAGPARGADSLMDRWSGPVAEASQRFAIPEGWIRSVMAAESAGRTSVAGRPIVSPAGAMGLMQLMPQTWSAMRSRYGLGSDPFDPHDNILAGTAYLRELFDRFGYPGLFAAYNAGPERFSAYRDFGRSLPPETRTYLAKMDGMAGAGGAEAVADRTISPLFFALGTSPSRPLAPASGGLFVMKRPS